jgi:hypothetical protein
MDESALAELEAEYCPPLDPALFSAIVSDYDLSEESARRDARATLDQLKESALLEEAAGFDPSGTGAHDDDVGASEHRAEPCPETSASRTQTDLTSISNSVSSLDLEEDGDEVGIGNAEGLEKLGDDTKIRLLQDLFGDQVSRYTIQHTLKKCGGKWQAAMEELLNHVYFEQAEHSDGGGKIAVKGIDAFADEHSVRRGRKGKSKSKKVRVLDDRRSSSLPVSPLDSTSPTPNRWQTAAQDIEFIASRTRIPAAAVSSVYYEQGASMPKTIAALLKASMQESKAMVVDETAVAANATELGYEFTTVAPNYLLTLVRLTYPSTTAAHDLATALTAQPRGQGGIQIVPRYAAPLALESDESWQKVAKKQRSPPSQSPVLDDSAAAARASAYASARAMAFSQASAAHRKAKSDRLMGGAAAYYGQVGREYTALSLQASAAAADELAASQSTPTQLDLHGIDVLNAIRIAQDRVKEWWDRLGESRINGRVGAEDRQAGYRIVVGLGRHSEGGKGKLGPAVSKALKQDGWRIENAGAVLIVKGKTKN